MTTPTEALKLAQTALDGVRSAWGNIPGLMSPGGLKAQIDRAAYLVSAALAQAEQPQSAEQRVAELDRLMAESIARFSSLDQSDLDPRVVALAAKVLGIAQPEQPATDYERRNPLGGPAKLFDAVADMIRAGEPVDAAMAEFGLAWKAEQPAREFNNEGDQIGGDDPSFYSRPAQTEQPAGINAVKRCDHCKFDVLGNGWQCVPGQCLKAEQPAEQAQPELKAMTPGRAAYFMERFKREEKLLGPNEQAAVDFVIAMLEPAERAQPAAWLVEIGAVSLPKGHPSRIVLTEYHDTEAAATASAAREPEFNTLVTPLYAAPPAAQPQPQPLTDADIEAAMNPCDHSEFARQLRRQFIESFKRVYFKLHPERANGIGTPAQMVSAALGTAPQEGGAA